LHGKRDAIGGRDARMIRKAVHHSRNANPPAPGPGEGGPPDEYVGDPVCRRRTRDDAAQVVWGSGAGTYRSDRSRETSCLGAGNGERAHHEQGRRYAF